MKLPVLLAWLALCVPAAAQPTVMGTWLTQNRDGVVNIHACPTGLCGDVVGITGFQPNGAPPVDVQGRSRCHLQIIPDGHPDDDGLWFGHITNPDDGQTYTIEVQPDGPDRLRMRGYIGLPLLGSTVYWTRFTGKLTPDCHIE
ncbi:MAG: DUF2147 domain-containing protein [Acetobacteraceae bacterium]